MMINRLLWCIVLFLTAICMAPAGDLATFVNLGFSDNSEYFMFAQYGIEATSGRPYAELFTVKVADNRFTPDGVRRSVYGMVIPPGQDPVGALYNLLGEAASLTSKYRINHIQQGRILYLLMNGDAVKPVLQFRDFVSGSSYEVRILQEATGEGQAVRASFHIEAAVTDKAGRSRSFTIGRPGFKRTGVREYRIKQILLSPNERKLVIVVEMDMASPSGKSVRYMVETARIR